MKSAKYGHLALVGGSIIGLTGCVSIATDANYQGPFPQWIWWIGAGLNAVTLAYNFKQVL